MKRNWSPAAEQRLRELYATTPLVRLAFLLKRTPAAIKSRAGVLGLTKGTRSRWTPAQDQILRKRYAIDSADAIARDLGCTRTRVYQRAHRLGLEKPDTWASECTRKRWADGRHENSRRQHFPKGHVPANKGLRRPGYSPGRMADTQFKKGQMHGAAQHNYVPIGTEKIDPKRNVLMRKVTDDPTIFPVKRWRPVHVLAWEREHGAVPAGHIVIFRRGLKTFKAEEITADRLELVTLAENMRRNTIHNYPPSIKDAMRLVGRINRQVRKLEREKQD